MLSGRLAKLRAMPPREIAHRVRYGAYTAVERLELQGQRPADPARLRRALVADIGKRADWREALLQRAARPFFAWTDSPDGIRDLFRSEYVQELARARTIADQVVRHEIAFFGETFRFGQDINWHADPITGAEWPRRYHRDVPVHGGNAGYGDVKHVWELNRHQFLVDLAKIAFLDRSQPHAHALFHLLKNWQSSVPYAVGVPWACALEPAFRAWSWMWAYSLVRIADMLPDDIHLDWLTAFYDHGRFLHRHLELYASPYNHLIGEASALFALGVLFPEFRESGSWLRHGRHVLESSVTAQFYTDGGTVEQSTFYHHATLGFYILAALLAARNGLGLAPKVAQAIERAIDFSVAMTQPDGRIPALGGADDGKPIRLEHLPFWDFRPYHAIGAVMFSRPDFKAVAGRFFEDALWMLGSAGRDRFRELPSRPPASSRALEGSGYFVARTTWSPEADYVCFDRGEQAAGLRRDNVPSAAHGHADCLSAVVVLAGRPVLVDPGFFTYNGEPEWEVAFRKTRAHNTVTIDDRDQARHVSKMAWTHTYAARQEGWAIEPNGAWARGSHDGYAHGQNAIIHRRTVWLRNEGYVLLYDEIVGSGSHRVQASFQFAPGTLTVDKRGMVVFDHRYELAWTCSVDPEVSIRCGEPEPTGGWVARSLGVREPAPRLVLDFPFTAPRVSLLTIVADRQRGTGSGGRTEAARSTATLLAARVRANRGDDVILVSDAIPVVWRGIETDAAVAVVSLRDGQVTASSHIGGSYLRIVDIAGAAATERR